MTAASVTRKLVRRLLNRPASADPQTQRFPPDFDQRFLADITAVNPFTMTTWERMFHLTKAVEYIHRNSIPGAIVECGVWRGGSMMLAARALMALGETERDLYLFDTFEGMPPPTKDDEDYAGETAAQRLERDSKNKANSHVWAIAALDQVKGNLATTNYPTSRTHFIKGRVEDTIPQKAPEAIALLRLDTDWYESTRHELQYLYPRVVNGGVVIIDDYGCWKGSRKAVDEFVERCADPILLNRLDSDARSFIKLGR